MATGDDLSGPMMLLATEWTGANGGHTINRRLAEELARAGHEVVARVAEDVFEGPEAHPNLTVSGMREYPGMPLSERSNLTRLEGLPPDVSILVGHGRFSGGAAMYLQRNTYPDAPRVHVVHAAVGTLDVSRTQFESIERQAEGQAESQRHEQTELALIDGSDLVVGVGPLLTRYAAQLAARCDRPPAVHELVPGVVVHDQPVRRAAGPFRALLFGRLGDPIKGTEIAARAVRELRARTGADVSLTLRGGDPRTLTETSEAVSELAGRFVTVKPFTTNTDELAADIRAADVVLMPSRNEGYGLVASEAAGHGVPVLVSGCSGFGELLSDSQRVPADLGGPSVVPMLGSETATELVPVWAQRMAAISARPDVARQQAHGLQQHLGARFSWEHVSRTFATALRDLRRDGQTGLSAGLGRAARLGFPAPVPVQTPPSPRASGPSSPGVDPVRPPSYRQPPGLGR